MEKINAFFLQLQIECRGVKVFLWKSSCLHYALKQWMALIHFTQKYNGIHRAIFHVNIYRDKFSASPMKNLSWMAIVVAQTSSHRTSPQHGTPYTIDIFIYTYRIHCIHLCSTDHGWMYIYDFMNNAIWINKPENFASGLHVALRMCTFVRLQQVHSGFWHEFSCIFVPMNYLLLLLARKIVLFWALLSMVRFLFPFFFCL